MPEGPSCSCRDRCLKCTPDVNRVKPGVTLHLVLAAEQQRENESKEKIRLERELKIEQELEQELVKNRMVTFEIRQRNYSDSDSSIESEYTRQNERRGARLGASERFCFDDWEGY